MLKIVASLLVIQVLLSAAAPADKVLGVWSEGLRYDYQETDAGELQLVDNWLKLSDYDRLARYDPDATNEYHLFTRSNPARSQPLVKNLASTVTNSNYESRKRTVILMHGVDGSAISEFNTNLVPAFLNRVDCNVIVLDWSAGSRFGPNAEKAGEAAGSFINWLVSLVGGNLDLFHIVGHGVGGHGAGIIGRTVDGDVGYITGLDPYHRWDDATAFRPTDGVYTEAIHTSAGRLGMTRPLAHSDFFPNGGTVNPGCITSQCDSERSFYYFAESVERGGFTARKCEVLEQTINCNLNETLNMGGHFPKTGRTGIYLLFTNGRPPFSQG